MEKVDQQKRVLDFFKGIDQNEFLIVTPSGDVVQFVVGPGQSLADELGRAYRVLESEIQLG